MIKRYISLDRLLQILETINNRVVSKIDIKINYIEKKILIVTPTFEYHVTLKEQNPFLNKISDEEFNQIVDKIIDIVQKIKIDFNLCRKIKPKEAHEIHFSLDGV